MPTRLCARTRSGWRSDGGGPLAECPVRAARRGRRGNGGSGVRRPRPATVRFGTTRWKGGERSAAVHATAQSPRGSGGNGRRQSPTCPHWRSCRAAARTPTSPSSGCPPRPGGRRWRFPKGIRPGMVEARAPLYSRGGARRLFNLWRRYVLPGRRRLAVHVHLQHPGLVDRLPIHLPLVVRPAVEEYPRRLQGIRMADNRRRLTRVLASNAPHDVEDASTELVDGLVARKESPLRLVHEPERPEERNFPVRQALQVPTELGLAQLRLGFENRRRVQPAVDQIGSFDSARKRAVHDALDVRGSQAVTKRFCLGAAQGAQLETVEVTVKQLERVLDVGMPDQVDARTSHEVLDARSVGFQARKAPTEVRLVPAERPASRAW